MRNLILGIQNSHDLFIMSNSVPGMSVQRFSIFVYGSKSNRIKDKVSYTPSAIIYIARYLFLFYRVRLSSIWMAFYHTDTQIFIFQR